METLHLLAQGFSVALTPENLFLCAMGVVAGTMVGALPGIGPAGATAILLPATFKLGPIGSLIMLSGIYYGTQYGGTITSVLMKIPGESASVVTMFDGNPLARQGKAGLALGLAAIGSFVGGTLSIVGLMMFGPPLANLALMLGPAEYFSLMVMALSLVSAFTGRSLVRALISMVFGLLLSLVGQDVMTGNPRLTFGMTGLLDGLDFLPVGVGLFGLCEIIQSFEKKQEYEIIKTDLGFFSVLPSLKQIRETFGSMLRGTGIGFLVGLFPGCRADRIVISGLRRRAADLKETGRVRARRPGRGGSSGNGQQRGHRRADGADAQLRPAKLTDNGNSAGSPDHVRPEAWPHALHRGAGRGMGFDGQHVHRQRHACGHQPRVHPPDCHDDGPD